MLRAIRWSIGLYAICFGMMAYARNFEAVKRAAQQGNADAQARLGAMYAAGLGVARDDAQAMMWYRKAAENGDKHAQDALEAMKKQASPAVR